MARGQWSQRLTDAEVREQVVGFWDEINAWHRRLGERWWPAEGSDLRLDAEAADGFSPSFLAWTSLAVGTDCLLTASAYALNFGPTLFSMHPLLRTAMFGGAQAVWLLAPDDQATRLGRAEQLARDSHLRHKQWADGLQGAHPEAIDPVELAEGRRQLAGLAGDRKGPEVFQTEVIRLAAEHLLAPADDREQLIGEVMAEWRSMSGVAHALPWEQSNRPGKITSEEDGVRTTAVAASWSQLQSALSNAHAFLGSGWRLLDSRGGAPTT